MKLTQQGWTLFQITINEWTRDNATRLAAALAYYTIFSIAPLLIIAIAVAGLVFGHEAAQGQIVMQLRDLVGQQSAEFIQSMIQNASQPTAGLVATFVGIATLLFGATGVFGELQDALNIIWNVKPRPITNVLAFLRTRFLSLTLVLGIGFLLLVSLILSALLSGISSWIQGYLGDMVKIAQTVNVVLGFGVITLLFALIYKLLPDVSIAWHDVWIGAAITAVLFNIGRLLIGFYLGNSSVGSTYGVAGSLVVVLIWVYYSAQILFFGAEFTQVYARTYGSRRREQHLLAGTVTASSTSVQKVTGLERVNSKDRQTLKAITPIIWLGTVALVIIGIVQASKNEPH